MRRQAPGRSRWVRVLCWLVIAYVLTSLAWTLAVRREPGTFAATTRVCTGPGDRGCHAVGTWTSEDGRTVLREVALDGSDVPAGTARRATRDTPLGPWPAPGDGDRTVHEQGEYLADVLVAMVLVTLAGTALWFDAGGGIADT